MIAVLGGFRGMSSGRTHVSFIRVPENRPDSAGHCRNGDNSAWFRVLMTDLVFNERQSQLVQGRSVGNVLNVRRLHSVLVEMNVQHPVQPIPDATMRSDNAADALGGTFVCW